MSSLSRRLDLSTEKIINAIKTKPALYNKKDPNYYTMNRFKGKLWKEVCREVIENWDQLKPQQRVEYDYDLQKRWKNLRTCFTRELAVQKKEKEDPNFVRLRKRYAYFDKMTFLLTPDTVNASDPDSSRRETVLEESSDEYDDDPLEGDDDGDCVSVKPEIYPLELEGQYEHEEITARNYGEKQTAVTFPKVVDVMQNNMRRDEEDEDKQFMLSLVPSMRKLNAKQKFTAKIAILNVLKDITFENS